MLIEKRHDLNVILAFRDAAAVWSHYPNAESFLRLTNNYELAVAYLAECLLEKRDLTVAYVLLALGLADEFKDYLDRSWEEVKATLDRKYEGPELTAREIERMREIGNYMVHQRPHALV